MVITEFLERNARLYGSDIALVEINPSEERDAAVTWRDYSLIESARPDAPYRREMSWKDFEHRANRFANLLLSRGLGRGAKVGILLMNCLEWLPLYFGILKAGCVAVPMNFRYSSDEIEYCLDLADVEVQVFGPEFVSRIDPIVDKLGGVKLMFFVGRDVSRTSAKFKRGLSAEVKGSNKKILHTIMKDSEKTIQQYLQSIHANELFVKYEECMQQIETVKSKAKRKHMKTLAEKLSDCKTYRQAVENSGLSASQLRAVEKAFHNLGISPITLRNSAPFDKLQVTE